MGQQILFWFKGALSSFLISWINSMLNLKWLQSYVWNRSQEKFVIEDNRYVNKRLYKKLEDGKHDIATP